MVAFEFREQVTGHLAHDIDQHVQTATVRHTDDDFLHAGFTGVIDKLVHRNDKAVAALERESLLPDIFRVQETLEAFGLSQLLEQVALALWRELGCAEG